MNHARKRNIAGNAISEVAEFTLGGRAQKVSIEGERAELPVLLILHGGPGSPLPFAVGRRGLFPELTDKYIVILWDQYGCGVNNAKLDARTDIARLSLMTVELIKELKLRFAHNRLYLLALSWGTVLSARAALEAPELIDGVVAYGQVLREVACSQHAMDALLASDASRRVKRYLHTFMQLDARMSEDIRPVLKWLNKYTDGVYASGKRAGKFKMLVEALKSPDYAIKDALALFINGYRYAGRLRAELSSIDLTHSLNEIRTPYHILQGERDLVTSAEAMRVYAAKCPGNPRLSIVKTESHIPGEHGRRKIIEALTAMAQIAPCAQ